MRATRIVRRVCRVAVRTAFPEMRLAMPRSLLPIVILVMLAAVQPAWAQRLSSAWTPPAVVQRYGLERVWYAQVQLDRSRHRLKTMRLHVSNTKAKTTYEVVHDGGRLAFTETDLDPFGNPLGKEGAQQRAEEELAALQARNQQATLETYVVPEITLYALGTGGTLQAIDAETGEPLWDTLAGNPEWQTESPGVSDTRVALVNGATLYLLDSESGEPLWSQKLHGAPGAGPAVTDQMVFVPMMSGRIQAYPVDEPTASPSYYQSFGYTLFQPTASSTSVAWPTDRGFLYVSDPQSLNVRFRLEANRTITSPATYRNPNMIFVSSVDGYVYAVHDTTGQILWRFSTGDSIRQSPIPVDDILFVVSEAGNLYRINAETGQEQWTAPQVGHFVAASAERVYVLGSNGRLEILNSHTGARMSALPGILPVMEFGNRMTDRIYLATEDGLIQCFRERQQTYPMLHVGWEPPQPETPAVEEEQPATQPASPAPVQPATPDPFGNAAPAPATPPAPADDNPFGDSPFGTP